MKDLKKYQDAWYAENAPLGKELGYPECCINEFCAQPPALLKQSKPTKEDLQRYQAGCINEIFTGFIPCVHHAKEIIAGKIMLHSLIKNRNPDFPPFPIF